MTYSPEELFKLVHDRTVITGGGSGIGRAVALALATQGGTVFVMGRREDKLKETASLHKGAKGKIIPVKCDVREWSAVCAAFDAVEKDGPAGALVHAASDVDHMLAEDITPEIFAAASSTILTGAFHIIQRWAKPLREKGQEGAAVIYTSASCGRESPGIAHSSSTKAGVESLARTMSSEWGRFQIRLNVIAPGWFPQPDMHHAGYYEDVGKRVTAHIPLGRPGDMSEIVGPTLFLLSKSARYVTGEIFNVDGGYKLIQWPTARPEDFKHS